MSGTIFSICSISAFSAQQGGSKRCRKECNKEQEKRELWQSRSRRCTWSRKLRQSLLQRRVRMRQVARENSEHPVSKVSNLIAQSAGKLVAEGSNQNDAASSSQVWLTDAKLSERARKLAAAATNQDPSFQEFARKLAAENLDINDEDDSKWPHNLRVSRANVPHLEKGLREFETTTQTRARR